MIDNPLIEKLLAEISEHDATSDTVLATYQVGDSTMQVVLSIGEQVTFKVHGDPYLMAMVKWLQRKLTDGEHQYLQSLTMPLLVEIFALPEFKHKNALLILQLIDKIYAKS